MKIIWLIFIAASFSCTASKNATRQAQAKGQSVAKTDTLKKDTAKSVVKPYKEVITDKAITDDGLFKVHKVDDKYFFEIPDAILEKDILIVNRISKGKFDGASSTYPGDKVGESMVRFSKGPNNKFFIKERAQDVRAADSSVNGMFRAVENTNLQPIIVSFDVKALSPDGKGVVLDVTDYINGDNQLISIDNGTKRFISKGLGGYLSDKSYVINIRSYPRNVEIKTVKTYVRGGGGPFSIGNATLELNCSIVLLPDQPMKPRFKDDRIGYFTTGYYNFEADKPVNIDWMIARWRLEPKEEDIERYKKGELVEPQKPIVFYIDPATPKQWVPYLKQGVKDWQKAFEKAGFKNAIYALEAPTDDSTWSIDDSRHNVIVYKASRVANAYGPQIIDPRSGEVLESHVGWFHNVQEVLHGWYMVQAGPNDPGGTKMQFDEALMGRLIRYVCAHEVGHTLGLKHNFGASSTVPVDSLRSKTYVRANGFCPSIMDYARFNYVTQPEDGMSREELVPRIGAYDEWAIEWGYKWLPDLKTRDAEKTYLNKWVINRTEKDKRLWFGEQTFGGENVDPKRQNQDLGDDAMKAGKYGIANLKRVVSHLKDWARVPNEGYLQLAEMCLFVQEQFSFYITHVLTNIGGLQWTDKTVEQKGAILSFPSRTVQKAAVQFLQEEVFTRPSWIMDEDLYRLMAGSSPASNPAINPIVSYEYHMNQIVLNRALNNTTYYNLMLAQSLDPSNAYSVDELLNDFESGIWKELATKSPISEYRRGVQKTYVERLINQLDPEKVKGQQFDAKYADYMANTDVYSIVKGHLLSLLTKINTALPAYAETVVRGHLMEVRDRLRKALYSKKEEQTPVPVNMIKNNGNAFDRLDLKKELSSDKNQDRMQLQNCWEVGQMDLDWHFNE